MTAPGYRRRQRRKGYPRQTPVRTVPVGELRAADIVVGALRQYRVLSPDDVAARYHHLQLDYRGRAG